MVERFKGRDDADSAGGGESGSRTTARPGVSDVLGGHGLVYLPTGPDTYNFFDSAVGADSSSRDTPGR